jgi:hypothetical protein
MKKFVNPVQPNHCLIFSLIVGSMREWSHIVVCYQKTIWFNANAAVATAGGNSEKRNELEILEKVAIPARSFKGGPTMGNPLENLSTFLAFHRGPLCATMPNVWRGSLPGRCEG